MNNHWSQNIKELSSHIHRLNKLWWQDLNTGEIVAEKLEYNKTRLDHKSAQRRDPNGKKF